MRKLIVSSPSATGEDETLTQLLVEEELREVILRTVCGGGGGENEEVMNRER